jgi:hypothetical protein
MLFNKIRKAMRKLVKYIVVLQPLRQVLFNSGLDERHIVPQIEKLFQSVSRIACSDARQQFVNIKIHI